MKPSTQILDQKRVQTLSPEECILKSDGKVIINDAIFGTHWCIDTGCTVWQTAKQNMDIKRDSNFAGCEIDSQTMMKKVTATGLEPTTT